LLTPSCLTEQTLSQSLQPVQFSLLMTRSFFMYDLDGFPGPVMDRHYNRPVMDRRYSMWEGSPAIPRRPSVSFVGTPFSSHP
jgi:hypothetical protein